MRTPLAECDERRSALKEALAIIDAALRLFAYEGDPAEIKAKRKRRWMFRRGELQRAVLDALRAAEAARVGQRARRSHL